MKVYTKTKTPNGYENESGVEYENEILGTVALVGILAVGVGITMIVCKKQEKIAIINAGGTIAKTLIGAKFIGS